MKYELAGEAECQYLIWLSVASLAPEASMNVSTKLLHEMHLRRYAFGVDHFLKHVDHVVELSVDVTYDDHRLLHA